MAERTDYEGPCPIEKVFRVFGGKWKPSIIYYLETSGTLRFNELRRAIPEVTQRMLTQQLRELERDGLVHREYYAEIPPRVEYSLTTLGSSFDPLGQVIERWGEQHMDRVDESRRQYDQKNQ